MRNMNRSEAWENLQKEAEAARKYYEYLIKEGFSEEEAFELTKIKGIKVV